MATTSLQSLHQAFLQHHHNHRSFPTSSSSPSFLKPTTQQNLLFNLSTSLTTTSSLLTPTTTTTSSSFDALAHHLSSRNFRLADEETRRLLIVLAGEPAQRRNYVFFSEAQFISVADLQTIDRLWRQHSSDRFGYSIQKRIWEKKAKRDFTKFFVRIGWMKKLDTDIEQYNYKSFPTEFIWELNDDTPEGHLPLTNALRGTQLLESILTHPAFDEIMGEGKEEEEEKGFQEGRERPKPMNNSKRSLNPDYSF